MKIYTKEMIKIKNEKKIRNKKIRKMILMPIIAIIIIICLYIAFQKIILKKPSIEIFGHKTYIVLTGSMKPTINPNDIVIVKSVAKEELKKGDIITFCIGNKTSTVTHRIIEIVQKDDDIFFKTKGDNNNSEDTDLVKYDNIEGIYCFKISKVGAILTGGLTGSGLVMIFLFLVLSYHYSSKKEDRILTREEARKRYNVYKYKDKEDENESI